MTIAIAIGGVTAIVLITLMIVIITVPCCFAVCSRKKENNQGNAPYELTANIAYHNWNDETSGDNSSPTAVYDYIIIDGSAPAGPRGNNHNQLIPLRSDSDFVVQKNAAYHH